jgi:hypothetical protein
LLLVPSKLREKTLYTVGLEFCQISNLHNTSDRENRGRSSEVSLPSTTPLPRAHHDDATTGGRRTHAWILWAPQVRRPRKAKKKSGQCRAPQAPTSRSGEPSSVRLRSGRKEPHEAAAASPVVVGDDVAPRDAKNSPPRPTFSVSRAGEPSLLPRSPPTLSLSLPPPFLPSLPPLSPPQ